MGRDAKRKRQRAAQAQSAPPTPETPETSSRLRHRTRLAFLLAIPVLTLLVAELLRRVAESRLGAGLTLLLGAALWLTAFAADVSDGTPRRDRVRYTGLGFGRREES